jgi:hypothetical protein
VLELAALLLALRTIAPLSIRAWSAGGGACLVTSSCSACAPCRTGAIGCRNGPRTVGSCDPVAGSGACRPRSPGTSIWMSKTPRSTLT